MNSSLPFSIAYKTHTLVGDVVPAGTVPTLLLLHGGGLAATRDRFTNLRQLLAERKIGSAAIDFIGHGETGGSLLDSSLNDRTSQASEVLRNLFTGSVSVLGTSMSAYTSIRLCERYDIDNLILCVPGIYSKLAYNVNFGPRFSDLIRAPQSWRDSDAWAILKRYRGRLLILKAGEDEVIPSEIPDRLFASAINAKSRTLYTVDDSPHRVFDFLNNSPEALSRCASLIADLITFGTVTKEADSSTSNFSVVGKYMAR